MQLHSLTAPLTICAGLLGYIGLPGNGVLASPAFSTLHFFTGPDGALPTANILLLDRFGALYGTTQAGGDFNNGTVFKLTPPMVPNGAWTEIVLYSFTGGKDGSTPIGGLIFDQYGALYGTTQYGPGVFAGNGTVFKLDPPRSPGGAWTEAILHTFTGNDGSRPLSGVIVDLSGALYGSTYVGGAQNAGTVFKLTPPAPGGYKWSETVLYNFPGPNRVGPDAPLIFDGSGALYGATVSGGSHSAGTIFKLAPPTSSFGVWAESDLYSFAGIDGAEPLGGLIFDRNGALYGTTFQGGPGNEGVVFKLAPAGVPSASWTETILHYFAVGEGPLGGLTFDISGALYGMKGGYTSMPIQGVIFKLAPPATPGSFWTETVVHAFSGNEGVDAEGSLVFDQNGTLYGATLESVGSCPALDGIDYGCGTVFKYTPPTPPISIISFTAEGSPAAGDYPLVNVIVDGKTIGSTSVGAKRATYAFRAAMAGGVAHDIQIRYTNDRVINGEDRNLILESIGVNDAVVLATSEYEVYHAQAGGQGDIPSDGNMYWTGPAEFKLPPLYFPPMSAADDAMKKFVR